MMDDQPCESGKAHLSIPRQNLVIRATVRNANVQAQVATTPPCGEKWCSPQEVCTSRPRQAHIEPLLAHLGAQPATAPSFPVQQTVVRSRKAIAKVVEVEPLVLGVLNREMDVD